MIGTFSPGSVAIADEGASGTSYTLSLGQGVYTLTGQALGLRVARTMPLGQGSYTLTGHALTLTRAKGIVLATGVYALTGEPLAFHAHLTMVLGQGAYVLTGEDLTLTVVHVHHHYRVHDQTNALYQAELTLDPLYQLTDDFAAKYRMSDISQES